MNEQIVELDKRTRVSGFWLLPGTRLEFATIGQANTFIYRNGGKNVSKRKATKRAGKADGSGAEASDASGSKTEPPFVPG